MLISRSLPTLATTVSRAGAAGERVERDDGVAHVAERTRLRAAAEHGDRLVAHRLRDEARDDHAVAADLARTDGVEEARDRPRNAEALRVRQAQRFVGDLADRVAPARAGAGADAPGPGLRAAACRRCGRRPRSWRRARPAASSRRRARRAAGARSRRCWWPAPWSVRRGRGRRRRRRRGGRCGRPSRRRVRAGPRSGRRLRRSGTSDCRRARPGWAHARRQVVDDVDLVPGPGAGRPGASR